VHDVTGLLVPTHDDKSMAEAIVALLRDPERRKRFGAAGRQRVIDEFSVEKMVERTVQAYERALSRPQAEGLRP
jgi:glycosyltransferase involved in cell wall biosynthesis